MTDQSTALMDVPMSDERPAQRRPWHAPQVIEGQLKAAESSTGDSSDFVYSVPS